jgi:predicted XRE-type DNA-binding protein
MLKINIDLWILIVCIAIPFLCLITTYFFIFNKKSVPSESDSLFMVDQGQSDFKEEITFQIACQQLDLLLVNTIRDLQKQRLFLQGYLTQEIQSNGILSKKDNKTSESTKKIVHRETKQKLSIENDNIINDLEHIENSMSSYEIISELFQSGMTSKQIAEKIKIPQAEVDLYIKLHFKENQNLKIPVSLHRLSD